MRALSPAGGVAAFVEPHAATETRLRCAECGQLSDADARGWRAYIAFVEQDGESSEALVLCPDWAAFEFGGA
jgi:hypothetical protein